MAILSDEFYYQSIRIDTINTRVFADIVAKEGDANGRGLLLTLTENGLMKDTTGIALNLKWEHTSVGNQGLDNFEVVDPSKGLYKITYPTEMLKRGKVRAFIQIIDSGKLAGTRNIEVTVDRDVGDDTAIASSDSFTALAQALIEVNNLESTYAPRLLSAEQQLAETIKVLKPSGTDDDTLIFQDAIDSMVKGVIVLEKGSLFKVKGKQLTLDNSSRLTDGIRLKSDITIDGNGATIQADVNCNYIFDTAIRTAITDPATNLKNITIKNLNLEKPNATWFEQSHLINIESCTNLTIENCSFKGWSGDAICFGSLAAPDLGSWLQSWIENVTIKNCIFDGVNKNNRQAISGFTGKNINIYNNTFKNTTRSDMPGAIDFEPEYTWCVLENITIQNNFFYNVDGSVGVITVANGQPIPCKNIVIQNNTIENFPVGHAIFLQNTNPLNANEPNNVFVQGNKIKNGKRFICINGMHTTLISDNVIEEVNYSSLLGEMLLNHNVRFERNTIFKCKDTTNLTAFVNFYNNDRVLILNNTIYDGGYTIFSFLSNGNTIKNVHVKGNELIDSDFTFDFLLQQTPHVTSIIVEDNNAHGKNTIFSNVLKPNMDVSPNLSPDDVPIGTYESFYLESADPSLPATTGIFISKKYTADPYYRTSVIQFFYPWNGDGTSFYIRKGLSSSSNTWAAWKGFTGI